MNRAIHAAEAPAPASNYAQAVEVAGSVRLLHISGQVGLRSDGTLPEDWQGQMDAAWRNVLAVLEAGGMGSRDLIEVFVILSSRDGLAPYREARDRILGDHRTASTLMIGALADPAWKVEIAARAAAPV